MTSKDAGHSHIPITELVNLSIPHQPLGGFEGPATDIDIHAREILEVRRQLDGILARHTAQSLERIREDTEREYFMDPRNAMEYGLIDDILQRRESLRKN